MHNPEQESSGSSKKQHFTKDYSGFTQPMTIFSESSYFCNFLNTNINDNYIVIINIHLVWWHNTSVILSLLSVNLEKIKILRTDVSGVTRYLRS